MNEDREELWERRALPSGVVRNTGGPVKSNGNVTETGVSVSRWGHKTVQKAQENECRVWQKRVKPDCRLPTMGCGTILASLGYCIQSISVVNRLYLAIGTEDVCGRRCPQLDTLSQAVFSL